MKKILTHLLVLISCCFVYAQDHGFKFGQFSYDELKMKHYEADSSASAVILNEFGETYVQSGGDYNVVFEYHVKIKILKADGLSWGDHVIVLHKYEDGENDRLASIEASTFTLVNNSAQEFKLDKKSVLSEDFNKQFTLKKITMPNVQIGSVVEIKYTVEIPKIFYTWKPWRFQDKIPKLKSTYWSTIPANYVFNITLRGFLGLSKNESEVVRACYTPGGMSADCIRYKFEMENVPAFIEEDYMTAPSNFIAGINFQLSEVKHFDGRVDKITKEWKDVQDELEHNEEFGRQLKKGKDILSPEVQINVLAEHDPLNQAKIIYDYIKGSFVWNENDGKYSEDGIRKAFENKKGNVGDINLALIASLRSVGLNVEPLILSTRENGLPIDIHPVITDFNYVIAKLNIGDKIFLLDATDVYCPFGTLPVRCLNGKGRVLGDKESYWYEIQPVGKEKVVSLMNFKLDETGVMTGTINTTHIGYAALIKRKEIFSFESEKAYITDFDNRLSYATVNVFTLENADDLSKPINEKLEVAFEAIDDMKAPTLFLNPFMIKELKKNPFKSTERLYPVDYAVPQERTSIITIEFPSFLEIAEVPAKVGLALPNNGGRFIYDVQVNGNRIVINSTFSLNKAVYSSEEYHYLKELYASKVQVQNTDLVFKRK